MHLLLGDCSKFKFSQYIRKGVYEKKVLKPVDTMILHLPGLQSCPRDIRSTFLSANFHMPELETGLSGSQITE